MFQNDIEYDNHLRGVLYTNLHFDTNDKLDTEAGSLLPTTITGNSNTVVYELQELIEKTGKDRGILISHGIDPYIIDFSAILSFALNCSASPSYNLIDRLLSDQRGLSSHVVPKKSVARVFDKSIYCTQQDEEHLIKFTKQLIGLNRTTYLGVMDSIRIYVTGMQRIAEDYELAYTLLVASIESLAQSFDGHKSKWTDYDQRKRKLIDAALSDAEDEISEKVRSAILEIEHCSLGRRFRDFSTKHLNKSYFREEAHNALNPISKFDLPKALSNAYQARSQYIHNLRKLPRQVTWCGSHTETCRTQNTTWLTIQGLSRLARHVITEFIMRQPIIEKEKYDYSLERAGIMQAQMAPQYWVGREDFSHGAGSRKLEGFLSQYVDVITRGSKAVLTDLSNMLRSVESKVDEFKKEDKKPFMLLYILFNNLVGESQRLENADTFCARFEKQLKEPSPESLILHLLFNITPTWKLDAHNDCIVDYFKHRDNKLKFRCPTLIESGFALHLAERYRSSGDDTSARTFIAMAVENYPQHSGLHKFETEYNEKEQEISWHQILVDPLIEKEPDG
ncbi:hypothetical protein [Vibrio coralliilyticus]|uniref:hypothetical protein n=1 Tax=Vibrio coralliilyticus TaxID=190893 RepID=UPI001F5B9180|nr:hypothetical protein [Vibrio coralliilyticus]